MEQRRGSAGMWDWPLQGHDGMVLVQNTNDRFEADLDVPTFRPNEIEVKYLNNELIINCFQQQEGDRVPREIHRSYVLPPDIDPSTIKSVVKNDGVLKITASKKRR